MTRPKHDPLLAALIARLPADAGPWPRGDRIAWLQMMAMAFNVVYGPCACIEVAAAAACDGHAIADDASATAALLQSADGHAAPAAPSPAKRFHVDRDGFAMGDGRPVAMEDLPAGAVLWDERIGIESGDASAILWRDVGASRRSLPPGVTLQPVFDES